jgi:hypothetical protein
MSKHVIPSSYDRQTVLIIPVVYVVLISLLAFTKSQIPFILSICILFFISIGASLILIPWRIYRDESDLVFQRVAGTISISLTDIEKIDKIDFSDLKRNMGIHGLLGYYGNYSFNGFGSVKVMSKSKLNLVLIQSKTNEPLVVSVDDVGFLSNF